MNPAPLLLASGNASYAKAMAAIAPTATRGPPTAPMAEAADLNGRVLALPSLANSNELAWM